MAAILEMTGVRLRLRLVAPEDAKFIHGLRTDRAHKARRVSDNIRVAS